MKVLLDHARCTGHGRCYTLAPLVFTCDDAGYAELVGDGTVAPELADQARLGAANCPERAITVED